MSLRSTRRRFIAFSAAFLGIGRFAGARAQVPTASQTVGSWLIQNYDRTTTAAPTADAIVTGSAQVMPSSGAPPVNVSAEIKLVYQYIQAVPGYPLTFGGDLSMSAHTSPTPSIPVRVLADGTQVDSFDLSKRLGANLSDYFGNDLHGLVPVKGLQIVATGASGDVVVYEVNLASTQMVLDTMVKLTNDWVAQNPNAPPDYQPTKCFLTTACVELIGLDDDCFELATLRNFRDTVMAPTPEGRRAIASYQRLAPVILAEVGRAGHERRLVALYFTHILPAVFAVRLGLHQTAIRIYEAMIRRLMADYVGSPPADQAEPGPPSCDSRIMR